MKLTSGWVANAARGAVVGFVIWVPGCVADGEGPGETGAGVGFPCQSDDDCAAGTFCVEAPYACTEANGEDVAQCCQMTGAEGLACGPDGECDDGLVCQTMPGSEQLTTSGCTHCCFEPLGMLNEPCWLGGCAEGFVCDRNPAGHCAEVGEPSCCQPAGGEGELCSADGTCESGLVCIDSLFGCEKLHYGMDKDACCAPENAVGSQGQPCAPGGECAAGLTCEVSASVCGRGGDFNMPGECCIPQGVAGGVCNEDGSCDQGLVCVDCTRNLDCYLDERDEPKYWCATSGSAFEPCNIDDSCDEGLGCLVDDRCPDPDSTCCVPLGGD